MQGDQAQVNIKFLNVVFYINLLLGMLTLNIILKGVMHGDYTLSSETSRLSTFLSSNFNWFLDLTFSNRQDNPRQIPYFSYFYACGKLTFKTTIKTKTTHYFDKRTTHFLICLAIGTFFAL